VKGHQVTGDGGIVDQGQALRVAPTDAELERAIASVPGVVSAGIDRSDATGRSRMRLRLAPGEDEQAVAWSVAATLRERFGIALDPDAIRPRVAGSVVPASDPVHVVRRLDGFGGDGARSEGDGGDGDPEVERSSFEDPCPDAGDPRGDVDAPRADLGVLPLPSANELADTRERLRLAAAQALDGVGERNGAVDLGDLSGVVDLEDLTGLARLTDLNGVADLDDPGGFVHLDDPGGVVHLDDLGGAVHLDDLSGGADLDELAQLPGGTAPMVGGPVRADTNAPGPEVDADPRFGTVIPRAVIRDLRVRRDARSVQVAVVLGHGDRVQEGRATSVPTSHGTLRAVAEAAVASLRGLSEGPLLVGIDRVSASHVEDSPVATVVLSLLTHRGEERLLGASIIHDCPERAVLRATLDALNRRVMPLLLERDGER
jgi:hypothetical protein